MCGRNLESASLLLIQKSSTLNFLWSPCTNKKGNFLKQSQMFSMIVAKSMLRDLWYYDRRIRDLLGNIKKFIANILPGDGKHHM